MKRPVALVGILYLLTQLLAAFLPQMAMWLFAAIFAVMFFICAVRHVALCKQVGLAVCTVCVALLLRAGYTQFIMQPVLNLAGTQGTITATVLDVAPGFAGDSVRATVRVTHFDGAPIPRSFKARADVFPGVQVGEQVRFFGGFMPLAKNDYLFSSYAKSVMIGVTEVTTCELLGQSHAPDIVGGRVRERLSANLNRYWPGDIGAIASAMAIGDKSRLSQEIKAAFRSAGMSHALVVSGLHLGIVSSFVYGFFCLFLRRKWAALCGIFAALLFAAISGFTPSIVRAGVAVVLYYGAQVCNRKSDALTSLGFAALLMCLVNPYAAVDISTLLSFSATLGVLAASAFLAQRRTVTAEGKTAPRTWRDRVVALFAVPVATTVATLPVLAASGIGVSLVGVLCNIVGVPLLGVIVTGGLILSAWNGAILLEPFARAAGLACGVCTRILYTIAQWAHSLPWAMVHVTGVAAVLTILGAAVLFYAGHRLHITLRKSLAVCAIFVLLCGGIYTCFDYGVVRLAAVGGGTEPALVVTSGLYTAVLFRGRQGNIAAVQDYLVQCNRDGIDLLVDLRRTGDTAALAQQFAARENIKAEALVNHVSLTPFYGVTVTVNHQKNGNYAAIDMGGFCVGTSCGRVDLLAYPASDVFVAGTSEPYNIRCSELLIPYTQPAWLARTPPAIKSRRVEQELCLVVRKNKFVQWKGASFDFS